MSDDLNPVFIAPRTKREYIPDEPERKPKRRQGEFNPRTIGEAFDDLELEDDDV